MNRSLYVLRRERAGDTGQRLASQHLASRLAVIAVFVMLTCAVGFGVASAVGSGSSYWFLGKLPGASASAGTIPLISSYQTRGYDELAWHLAGKPTGSSLHLYINPPCSRIVGAVAEMSRTSIDIAVYGTPRQQCVSNNSDLLSSWTLTLKSDVNGRPVEEISPKH